MPKYSYKCSKCENKFEVDASIKEKEEGSDKFNCPKCKCADTKQIFSLKSFFSKGSGNKGGGGCCCGGSCGR
jgi:putative FmdB family regulatory protein